ncbi:MAG: metallophosphoesterase [Clostridia bacterium]|nr:metallophosphoesterase [Clostridia bacterium]
MKLGVFTDPHYAYENSPEEPRRPGPSLERLREALTAFKEAKVEGILCLGDWIKVQGTTECMTACLQEFAQEVKSAGLPVYTCMGNHDNEIFTREEFKELTGLTVCPCVVEDEHSKVILLDANFMRTGEPWPPRFTDWTQTAVPADELAWLEEQLCCEKTCVVALHQNLDPNIIYSLRVENADAVRNVIRRAGNVPLVLQGHEHRGGDAVIDGTRYLTLKSMSEEQNSHFICEI